MQFPDPMHTSRSMSTSRPMGAIVGFNLRIEVHMSEFENVNFFTDRAIQDDPYPYFDWVRQPGPVWREPNFGMYIVTGHPEAMAIYSDPATFPRERAGVRDLLVVQRGLRVVRQVLRAHGGRRRQRHHREVSRRAALQRPAPLVRPAEPHGTPPSPDATHHAEAPQGERGLHVAVRRPPHRRVRRRRDRARWSATTPSPSRSRSSPTWRACPSPITPSSGSGCRRCTRTRSPTSRSSSSTTASRSTSRTGARHPGNDVLTGLATATFPDGSTPEVKDAALIAANLFAGGQETTVRLLSFALADARRAA